MNKTIIAGWDPGRLNNKLYIKGQKIINMNAICTGYERRTLEEETGEAQNYLDVDFFQDEQFIGRYFVGGMAYKHNQGDLRWSTNGLPKFHDNEGTSDEIVKLITHLALAAYKPGQDINFFVRLGTGAPTEEYFEQPHLLDAFQETLKSHEYRVVFNHAIFKNASVKIKISEVHFKPEGTASVLSMCYTDTFQVKTNMIRYLEKGPILGMNIGSSTTDIAILGPGLVFEPAGFFGIPVGSSYSLNQVRDTLYKQHSYSVNKIKLDYLIRNYPRIKYKGETINLQDIVKQPLNNLASLLKTKFYDQVEMKALELGELGALFVSGGTALLLNGKLDSFIQGVPTVVSHDPLFEDARGYFLEAMYFESKSKKPQEEIFQYDNEIEVDDNEG